MSIESETAGKSTKRIQLGEAMYLLLPSRKEDIYKQLNRAGFARELFEWEESGDKNKAEFKLTHKPTEFYFKFKRSNRNFTRAAMSPAATGVEWEINTDEWQEWSDFFPKHLSNWLRYLQKEIDSLRENVSKADNSGFSVSREVDGLSEIECPPVIQESLTRFKADHSDQDKVAFVMMQFGKTSAHEMIVKGIRAALAPHGIAALRADEKHYHDDLFPNVLTYIYGCGLGVAVFERIEADDFNPNVALEVGYMLALGKPVCYLKDRTLRALPTDLVGKLYRDFDSLHPVETIPKELRKWLYDKHIVENPVARRRAATLDSGEGIESIAIRNIARICKEIEAPLDTWIAIDIFGSASYGYGVTQTERELMVKQGWIELSEDGSKVRLTEGGMKAVNM